LDFMLHSRSWDSKSDILETNTYEQSGKSSIRSPNAKNYVPVPDAPAEDSMLETISDTSFILDDEVSMEYTPTLELPRTASSDPHHKPSILFNLNSSSMSEPVQPNYPDKKSSENLGLSIPKPSIDHDPESSDEEVIEEYVSITKRKPFKVRHRSRTNPHIDFACKVCDKMFDSGPKVSAHVFMIHLQRMTDTVWHDLYTTDTNSNTKVCRLCGEKTDRTRLAKLHHYTQHKRNLKCKMEEKEQDWRNLLDYIQYKVTDEMINDEEVTESETESRSSSRNDVHDNPYYCESSRSQSELLNETEEEKVDNPPIEEISVPSLAVLKRRDEDSDSDDGVRFCTERRDEASKVKLISDSTINRQVDEDLPNTENIDPTLYLPCTFSKCIKTFNEMSAFVDHYLTSHQQSPIKLALVKTLAPDRYQNKTGLKATIALLGEVREVFSCPQCEVLFVELQLQARHVARHSDPAVVQCSHCRNFVKAGERDEHQNLCQNIGEWDRVQDLKNKQSAPAVINIAPTTAVSKKSAQEEAAVPVLGKIYPCTHRKGGCKDTFNEKKSLHEHARKCKHRPNTSYACQHAGCSKRYYYKEDYEKHVARFHTNTVSGNVQTSSGSTPAICAPMLPTNNQGTPALPSQQSLMKLNTVTHKLPNPTEGAETTMK